MKKVTKTELKKIFAKLNAEMQKNRGKYGIESRLSDVMQYEDTEFYIAYQYGRTHAGIRAKNLKNGKLYNCNNVSLSAFLKDPKI